MELLVPVILSVASAMGCLGYLVAVLKELSRARTDLAERVKEFDEITRKASDANVSMAEKLLNMDERLGSLEFKLNAQNLSAGWKK